MVAEMDDALAIDNRSDFAQWAVERASAIVGEQGATLALASRDGTEDEMRLAGNALGAAIADALLEVFDGLLDEQE
jgi:hypothetical protein